MTYHSSELREQGAHTECREWREARKLSAAALAEFLGVSSDALLRWERGEIPASKIAEKFEAFRTRWFSEPAVQTEVVERVRRDRLRRSQAVAKRYRGASES